MASGESEALDQLIPIVYAELRRIARAQLRRWRPGETLGTTALVNEAYLKLARQEQGPAHDRCHFFAIAATAMRQILVDQARQQRASKRGDGALRVDLDVLDRTLSHQLNRAIDDQADHLLDLDRALRRLTSHNPRLARVVECRFFAGMTEQDIAVALDITDRTVRRDWLKARAWLYRELDHSVVSPLSNPSTKSGGSSS